MFGGNTAYVTVATTQEISGNKTFTGQVDFTDATVTGLSASGNVDLSNYMTLASSSTQTITGSKIFTGTVDLGGASLTLPATYTPDMSNYMTLSTLQNVSGTKYFTGNVTFGKNANGTSMNPKPTLDLENVSVTWPSSLDNLNIPWSQITSKPSSLFYLDSGGNVSGDLYLYSASATQKIYFGKNSNGNIVTNKPIVDFGGATINNLSYSSLSDKPTIPSFEDDHEIAGNNYFCKKVVGTPQKLYFGQDANGYTSTHNLDMILNSVSLACTSNTIADFSNASEFYVPTSFKLPWSQITGAPSIGIGDVTTTGSTTQTISRNTTFSGTVTLPSTFSLPWDQISSKPTSLLFSNTETANMYRDWETDRKSTRLNSSHLKLSRMPSSA